MDREERSLQSPPVAGPMSSADLLLLELIRAGDRDAGHRFIRDYYPGVYRYLLYLTGSSEAAEDLTQETFLQAWCHLDAFQGRAALRTWLHRIAHREFLQALRSRQRVPGYPPQVGERVVPLEEAGDVCEPYAVGLTEAIELRVIIGKLPVKEREIVVLHYLEGYQHEEIAHILGIPVRRVRQRLAEARCRLQQELAEGDLLYLNEPSVPMRQWAWLPLDQMYALETRLSRGSAGGREAPRPGATMEEPMERREFLRQAVVGAAGLMLPEMEKEVVDSRLTQKVICAFKGTALSDLCEQLRADTGVHLVAGNSVADEKVTLFCEKLPLREVMRQLSRPFGYTWLRSGTPGKYRYELVQDLRSQLLEEELRNRDRNAALLALEKEIERYRPYLDLSPDEALATAKTAPEAEKKRLETLASVGWGAIQMYFRLSSQDLAALRRGEPLRFSEAPRGSEQPLPGDLARGALQSLRDFRVLRQGDQFEVGNTQNAPGGVPLTAVPEARGSVILTLTQAEPGRFALNGGAGYAVWVNGEIPWSGSVTHDSLAAGTNPTAQTPRNGEINARLAQDAALRRRVTLHLSPSPSPARGDASKEESSAEKPSSLSDHAPVPPSLQGKGARALGSSENSSAKVTTADVLEALQHATGLPLVADYYTRLYVPAAVSVTDQPLFDALNHLADAMRLRWTRDGAWLQFRSASFYDDRLKEVPNRLLSRWTAARRARGALTLDELIEIAQLPDAQLDADEMAEGAREYLGLAEWDLPRSNNLRAHLRFLALLTPEQRRQAASTEGLLFTRMSLAQQQPYLALGPADLADRIQSLEELATATVRVDYTQPGWFQWGAPSDPQGRPRPVIGPWPVRERTQAAALTAARRLNPTVTEAQLGRTELDVKLIYLWHAAKDRYLRLIDRNGGACYHPW